MSRQDGAPELELFHAPTARTQPRAQNGRFVRVDYSPHRLKVLEKTRKIREQLGLPASPFLSPYGDKNHD